MTLASEVIAIDREARRQERLRIAEMLEKRAEELAASDPHAASAGVSGAIAELRAQAAKLRGEK